MHKRPESRAVHIFRTITRPLQQREYTQSNYGGIYKIPLQGFHGVFRLWSLSFLPIPRFVNAKRRQDSLMILL